MAKAATVAASAAASGGDAAIGSVIKAGGAAAEGGDEASVNGIASGIKGIVEAAEKADAKEGKLNAADGGDKDNADAGKLFAKKKNDNQGGGAAEDAGKAAAAVSAVSGEQILKAIVDAAAKGEEKTGVANVKEAENPIDAAIGSTGDHNADAFDKDGMKKDDQIAAAMVLRGMAKGGQFALKNAAHANAEKAVKNVVESAITEISKWLDEMAKAATVAASAAASGGSNEAIGNVINAGTAAAEGGEAKSVNGIASGIKGIVEAAEKAGEKEGKLNAAAGGGEDNKDAGKLFAKNNNQGGEAADAGKAAAAVSAVSGEQILKAIVDAAKGGEKTGVDDVKNATNPIEAAIGSTDEKDADEFKNGGMTKDDQIAAAMVLRGMAKGGQFALKNAAHANTEKAVKNVVESAIKEISEWLDEMAKAATAAASAAASGSDKAIGDVINANTAAATGGDATSVNGIASGIKGIVEAAEKADEKEGKLNAGAGDDKGNKSAGKLFAKKKDNNGGGAADAGKAAAAVSAVSGEQILKAIVEAAAKGGDKTGVANVKEAENPIDAAIGSTGDHNADAFDKDGMKKDDQIAAAMVLRGMAQGGQFAFIAFIVIPLILLLYILF
ncbi:variable large family protein (plasmid) [Borreliella valaisiana]|nr:variable large family protein [Borreliella valaisiana]WLN25775.1 variable large family protein [Borreliella valaisiana]